MIKMSLHETPGLNLIDAYANGQVQIQGVTYAASLLVLPNQIMTDWVVADIDCLDAGAIQKIAQHKPEIVLLGTGDQQHFPDPAVLRPLVDVAVGYEIMDNAAACRTYNILLSEGREAALALLAV